MLNDMAQATKYVSEGAGAGNLLALVHCVPQFFQGQSTSCFGHVGVTPGTALPMLQDAEGWEAVLSACFSECSRVN